MWPFSSFSSPSSPASSLPGSSPPGSSSSSSSSPSSSKILLGEKIENPAPSRQQRAECWTSRDAYFDCLTKNGIVQAGLEGEEKKVDRGFCAVDRGAYETKCGKTWIEYFNKRRMLEASQRGMLEAASKQGVATAMQDRDFRKS